MEVSDYPRAAKGRKPIRTWQWVALAVGFSGALGMILFPIFSGPREIPDSTSRCISNLHQNSLGILLYLGDYDGTLPPTSHWMNVIQPYTENEEYLRCSKVKKGYGYAMERLLDRHPAKDLQDPASIPLIFDSDNLSRNAASTLLSLPAPPRHGKVNFVGRLDGNVKHFP